MTNAVVILDCLNPRTLMLLVISQSSFISEWIRHGFSLLKAAQCVRSVETFFFDGRDNKRRNEVLAPLYLEHPWSDPGVIICYPLGHSGTL